MLWPHAHHCFPSLRVHFLCCLLFNVWQLFFHNSLWGSFFFFFFFFWLLRQEHKSSFCYYIMARSHGGSPLIMKFCFLTFALVLYIFKLNTDKSTLSHFLLSTLLRCRDYIKAQKNAKSDLLSPLQISPCLLIIFSPIKICNFQHLLHIRI